MADSNEFLDWWEAISNTALGVAKYSNSKAEAQANRETALKIQAGKESREDYKANLSLQRDFTQDVYQDNQKSIQESINQLETFNLNAQDLYKLSDQHTSLEGQEIFKNRGIEINNDLQVQFSLDGEMENTIDNMNYAIGVQNDIINSLGLIENEINDLQPHLNNVAKEDGLNLVKDLPDFNNYIKAQREKETGLFPVDDPETDYDEAYLSRAFTSDKMLKMGEPWGQGSATLQATREALLKKEDTASSKEMNALLGAEEDEKKRIIRSNFDNIAGFEQTEVVKDLLDGANVIGIDHKKGDMETYLEPQNAKALKGDIETIIIQLLKNNLEESSFFDISMFPGTKAERGDALESILNAKNTTDKEKALTVYQIHQMIMPKERPIYENGSLKFNDDGSIATSLPANVTSSGLNNSPTAVNIGIPMYGDVDDMKNNGSSIIDVPGWRELNVDLEHSFRLGELWSDVSTDRPVGEQSLVGYLNFWASLQDLHPDLKLDHIEGYHEIFGQGRSINPSYLKSQGVDIFNNPSINYEDLDPEELARIFSSELQNK